MKNIYFCISNLKLKTGQSLIELLLAIGLSSIFLPALITGIIASREGKPQQQQRLEAVAILKETQEAVRNVREKGWTTFANNGTFHAEISGSSWTLVTGAATTSGGFTQQIIISDVNRDTNGQITTSGGIPDPSTKQVLITISWTAPRPSSINSTSYLTRHENISQTQTTQADFDAGTKINTFTTNTDGGEIILGAGGGGGDWCVPSKSITTVDLPKNGVANGVTAIQGTVFAGTGDNASGVALAKVNLTTNQDPLIATIAGEFNSGNAVKTNAVFGEQNYAYLTTDTNKSQVVILDLNQFTDPPTNFYFKKIGSIDLGSSSLNGDSIYVTNNTAYITASGSNKYKLFIYNVTDRTNPVLLNNATGMDLDGAGKKILVVGNYAYIATNSTTKQMDIVNIANPASPTITGSLSISGGIAGVDVYVNTANQNVTRAYLVTTLVSGKKDFYIVNVSTPSSPSVNGLSSYSTTDMNPTGVTVVTGNKAVIVGTGGTNQYQVINISNETGNLTSCANLQYSTGVFGVASVLQDNGYAYSYIITGDSGAELKIILGGAGGQYTSAGTFESSTINGFLFTGMHTTEFNSFKATISKPTNTDIKIRVAVAAAALDGSCNGVTFTYLGPNGDPNQYFTITTDPASIQGTIPYISSGSYTNPGQCFRYKAYFSTTDSTATPELYDFTVNFSP